MLRWEYLFGPLEDRRLRLLHGKLAYRWCFHFTNEFILHAVLYNSVWPARLSVGCWLTTAAAAVRRVERERERERERARPKGETEATVGLASYQPRFLKPSAKM